MKMKTLTVNGQSFQVMDEGAVRYDEAQTLTEEQKAKVRKTIGAMESGKADSNLDMNGYRIYGAESVTIRKNTEQAEQSPYVQLFVAGTVDTEEGEERSVLGLDSLVGGNTVVRYVHAGIEDNDAANVGQLKAALQEKQAQLDKLASRFAYKNLYGRVTVTAEDVAAAGDEGIMEIAIGSATVDLSQYNDILVKVYIPKDEILNTEFGLLRIAWGVTASGNKFVLLSPQSGSLGVACKINHDNSNSFMVKMTFTDDTFLYGQVMKNGYGTSWGYAGVQNCWTEVDPNGKKSNFHYFRIADRLGKLKFPAGSYVEVYGR